MKQGRPLGIEEVARYFDINKIPTTYTGHVMTDTLVVVKQPLTTRDHNML
jgi:hypothetical protein